MEAAVPTFVDVASLNRSSFPEGFIFGTASSAYQSEGAANEGGRGPSTWDTATHKTPEKIKDRSNGDVASDQYHRYKEDVKIMKYMNTDAYRFSISWSRILPKGKISSGINQEGITYYNNLINELLDNGLKPFVTLFHWDLPQALEDEYGGFLSPHIINDFQDYAELCFKEFGDRVKLWVTVNEPFANSLCSEPYTASHYQLLAHGAAVKIYKTSYQATQKGLIGISLHSHWFVPFSDDKEDHQAAKRAHDFMFGWFMKPLTKGEYPKTMQSLVGNQLPNFTEEQSKLLAGSFDFIGINYYTTMYAANMPNPSSDHPYDNISQVKLTNERNGIPIGSRGASPWLYVYPRGIRELLLYIKREYNDPVIYITENGMDEFNDPTLPLEEALMDTYRIDYFYRHLYYVSAAIKDGVKVQGYFAWSLLDSFEWGGGYTKRFGINFVDYKDNLKRYQKLSAHWFRKFLEKH
ncbi:beta-glucosidase 12-like [Lotus japonicus]|uniref:beta-glucosidase 12-like n=1 Tax=Lotus japonicus TaxID=34305 RepID=UPI00258790C8|nr:beta-glucosidase 12-like [Lotus japonicus]XP_057456246.1 beta-glucosidase 12-like [Lotus japonicus]